MRLAERARRIIPSPTLAIDSLAKQMKADGIDVVGFGAGEPDFDTPAHIRKAAIDAIEAGHTRYTATGGIPELKAAIAEKVRRDHGLEYTPEEVVVSCGAKQVLYNAFQVLLEPGDEVIIPAPYWLTYLEQVRLAGGVPVVLETRQEDGFVPTPELLASKLTDRTRAVVLNSPNNPTGAVYPQEVLEGLARVLLDYPECAIISDEIYESLVYDQDRPVSIAAVHPDIKARTLIVNGVSKAYAMTGWRIGYAVGPKVVAKAMTDLQSQSTSNPTSISQRAALAALEGPQGSVEEMRRAFDQRRRYMVERLARLPGVTCPLPGGAFYAFPRVDAAFGRSINGRTINNSDDLAQALLEEAHVALVPGSAFGADNFIRLSYATSMEAIEEGLDRIEAFWNRLMA